MARRIPTEHSRVMPYLHYRDPDAALDFLAKAFGFTVRFAHRDEAGVVRHAQVGVGPDTFMLGPVYPAMGSAVASELPGVNASIWCYVDDADAHFARARAAGAKILREPTDQPYGVREYDALDCEGQEWYFCQPLDDATIAPRPKKKRAKPKRRAAKAAKRKPARRRTRRR
jgi:uncharacterized glyoxalase superfamily protein PhnB